MSAIDIVNRVFREFRRYTGDGLPGEPMNAPLPVGDPSSGVHSPKKSEIRAALLAPIKEAEDAADRAEQALADSLAMIVPDDGVTEPKIAASLALQMAAVCASRAALKALSTTRWNVAWLKEGYRQGMFVWRSGDYAAEVAADTGEGLFIKANGVSAGTGVWERIYDSAINVRWFGAVGDGVTDDLPAIQAVIDFCNGPAANDGRSATIAFPPSEGAYAVNGTIRFTGSNLHLIGGGGSGFAGSGGIKPTILYIGTGAAAAAVIRADKALDNDGENYQGNALRNLIIDGGGKALHGFKANGWTRQCRVEGVTFTKSVNQIHVDEGYYSVWDDIECQINQATPPAGMLQATFDANKRGAYFHICHAMRIGSLRLFEINGTNGNNFDSALHLSECDAAQIDVLTVEGCDYVRTGIDIPPGCDVKISTVYSEANRFTERWCRVNDNVRATLDNHYINDLRAPILFHVAEMADLTFNGLTGFNIDCATAVFKALTGSMIRGVKFAGGVGLQVGAQDGSIVDASTTTFSREGIPSDGMILWGTTSGDFITGYGSTLGATYIEVGMGKANVNGQVVGWGRVSSAKQRLYPDLSYAGTWVLKISGPGVPYIEKAASAKIGSGESVTIATFSTPGGGGPPTGLASA